MQELNLAVAAAGHRENETSNRCNTCTASRARHLTLDIIVIIIVTDMTPYIR
jgi:hypothetical protein